jgi:leucyl aminopeptidase
METMKLDMAGAAAVLGLFHALSVLKPNVTVVGLIAACENMPSGKAVRPGDILRAMNGKTIEVLNTDAEGRLTLADMLSFAVAKEKPDAMIDLATLTGACMVALGDDYAGLFGSDEKLVEDLKKAAQTGGEKLWQLPLPKEYKDLIKSPIADLKNIQTGRYGGAVTAALFLEEFTGGLPWAHLDIAGPAFAEKPGAMYGFGATGYGVRLLIDYISGLNK